MTETKTSRVKKKLIQYGPEILTGVGIVVGLVAAVYLKKNLKSTYPLSEPDRLAGASMIVLENVKSNLWRDMDEPMNHYWLNAA